MKILNKKFFKKNKSGFTLVELIIVITILSILATIAFISFQGYTKDSRDTNRLATINSLEKGLQIHQVKVGKLPLPENAINIIYSGTIIGYQGAFGENNSRLINMSKIPLDPLDNTSFTYNVNSDLNAYQITGFFESKSNLAENNILQKTYAGNIDYSSRVPRTFGKDLGVLLLNTGSDLNRPLQEKYNASSFTGIDVKTYNGSVGGNNVGDLKVIFKANDTIIGTGNEMSGLELSYKQKIRLIMLGSCPSGWGDLGNLGGKVGSNPVTFSLSGVTQNYKVCEGSSPSSSSQVIMTSCPSGWSDLGNLGGKVGSNPITFSLSGTTKNYKVCQKN